MGETLKIAVVGLGNRGPQHLCTIVGLPDRYRLVGICDMVPEKLKAAVDKFGAPGFSNAEEMMDRARPNLVVFTVSHRDLPDLVKLAADRKIHVATETPIAATLPVADLLIETARKGGIKLENFEQCWRWPREQLKRKVLASGALGEMVQARCYTYIAPYHATGVFLKMVGSHVKQVVGYGRELRICPQQKTGSPYANTRKWVIGALEFENGVSGVFEMKVRQPYISGHDFSNCAADCTQGHLIHEDIYIAKDAARPKAGGAHQEKGNLIHYPIQEGWEEIQGRRILTKVWIDTDPEIAWENPYRQYAPEPIYPGGDDYGRLEEYISYHRAIVEDAEPEYGTVEARHNIEVMIAAHHSARLGSQTLTLPLVPKVETSFW
jgi:predicted dehydrogenase